MTDYRVEKFIKSKQPKSTCADILEIAKNCDMIKRVLRKALI